MIQASQQILAHLCDLIATCVRTQAQRDAFENAQNNLSKSQNGPETWDSFVLLSSALETAPIQVGAVSACVRCYCLTDFIVHLLQLAEAIIRTMTALLKEQSPSKGVRLPSQYIGTDGKFMLYNQAL
jgi:hypothetical protein